MSHRVAGRLLLLMTFAIVGGAAAGEDAPRRSPFDVLHEKDLRQVGRLYLLDEGEIAGRLDAANISYVELVDALARFSTLAEVDAQMERLLAEKLAISREAAEVKVAIAGFPAASKKTSDYRNLTRHGVDLRENLNLHNREIDALKTQMPKVAERRSIVTEAERLAKPCAIRLDELQQILTAIATRYRTLARDEAVRWALAELKAEAGFEYRLGPSEAFHAAEKRAAVLRKALNPLGIKPEPAAKPSKSAAVTSKSEGWVRLFDARSLDGWEVAPGGDAQWQVTNGSIVGTGSRGILKTKRDDFRDFRLRVEGKVGKSADAGVFFRVQGGSTLAGYEADLNNVEKLCGSLLAHGNGQRKPTILSDVDLSSVRSDEWFALEVEAEQGRIRVTLNGRSQGDVRDSPLRFEAGAVALGIHAPNSRLMVRKVEIRDLGKPSESIAPRTDDSDLFQPGSVWRHNGTEGTFTVLDRDGTRFRAQFEPDSRTIREIEGTIKPDHTLFWIGEKVKVTKGKRGGNGSGTVKGDVIAMRWFDNGDSGEYLLTLQKK